MAQLSTENRAQTFLADADGRLEVVGAPAGSASAPIAVSVGAGNAATATRTNVASSASSVAILAANTAREGATVFNDSSAILYLELGSATASTSNYTVQIAAGGYYEVPYGWTGALTGIWSAANGAARVTELTA